MKLKQNKLSISLLSGLLLCASAHASKDDYSSPIGCRDLGYEFVLETLHLVTEESDGHQSLYFLFNNSNQPINLFQMRNEDSAHSAYLNHAIGARQWAVLSTNEKRVKFVCTLSNGQSQYGDIIDCAASLRVCEYTNVRYGLNNRGNYWLVNSDSKNGAINEVVRYGIIPGR